MSVVASGASLCHGVVNVYKSLRSSMFFFFWLPSTARCKNDNSYFDGECFNFVKAIGDNLNTCPSRSPDDGSRLAYIKSQPEQTFVKKLASSSLPPQYLIRMGLESRNSA